jgi:hypothetical protein
MFDRLKRLLRDYEDGCGYRKGDVLRPRPGATNHLMSEVVGDEVIVLRQSAAIPHQYDVIGERKSFREPSDRFIRFEINGHDFERAEAGGWGRQRTAA